MNIGVFHGRTYYLRNVDAALETLTDRGHELVLALSDKKAKHLRVPSGLRERVSAVTYPYRRDDGLDPAIRLVRSLRDAARYETPALRETHANRERAYRKLRQVLEHERLPYAPEPPAEPYDPDDLAAFDATLAAVDGLIPPSEPLVAFIRGLELDAALVVSRVNFGGNEAGVVRAAQAAGVPVGVAVYSWDNLSSKGLLHELPDRLFVWNDVQAREAVELHGADPATVVATGAPRFDELFALSPSAPREELLGPLGLNPARKTVLWLGSSGFVSKREPQVIERWLARIPADVNVIVRPHPGAADEPAWASWRPRPGVAAPPPRRRAQDLFDVLYASDAVVALNTSAELEAGIVGRPVLTLAAGEDAPGQGGSLHFRYLLAEEGGFVEHAETLDEHFGQLQRALAEDPLAEQRAAFVESFLRPAGPAAEALASAVEDLASSG